jgi:hypothetical protein
MFRYPLVYGRGALGSCVWQVMERVLDQRPHIVLPDGGQPVVTRGYAPNMAHAVLLSVDQPERAGGSRVTSTTTSRCVACFTFRWQILAAPLMERFTFLPMGGCRGGCLTVLAGT